MLSLSRDQILAYRRRASALDVRLPKSSAALERVASAGLQDSMPRAALLSIHARVEGTTSETWEKPPLVQVWGPRYSAYVIAEADLAMFTLGRLPERPDTRRRAEEMARRLEDALAGERMDCRDVAQVLGVHPNALRYAAPTGRFLIYWDGARQPLVWSVAEPEVEPIDARIALLRRYLHILGPADSGSFASWAGIRPPAAAAAFERLENELVEVDTPVGQRWILASDGDKLMSAAGATSTRLIPSGDTYYLLQGDDRELLIPDEKRRNLLWTPRVWPGAVLHRGEIVGTWRRSQHKVTVDRWVRLSAADREVIEGEAASFPIPGMDRPIEIHWT